MTECSFRARSFASTLLFGAEGILPVSEQAYEPGWFRQFITALAGRSGLANDAARSKPEASELEQVVEAPLHAQSTPDRDRKTLVDAENDYRRAQSGGVSDLASAAIRFARLLISFGLTGRARAILREAISLSRRAVVADEVDTLEPLADLLRESGRKSEAIRLYELAAIAGRSDAVQKAVDLILDTELVPAVAGSGRAVALSTIAQGLPQRERQVLALTAFGTAPDYEYVGDVLKLSPHEVMEYERTGLALLTSDERTMLQLMDPKDRARYLLQKRIQEKAEMVVLLSELQSLRHQTAASVINNIR